MKTFEPKNSVSIKNVLFATDFSPATEAAFAYAVAIADRYHSKLYLVHVINTETFDLLELQSAQVIIKQAKEAANRKLTQLVDPLGLPRDRYQIVVAEGVISETLLDIVRQNQIDLVVLGTHGRRALKKLFMGSTAEEMFRLAPCPVLTVGPKTAPVPTKGPLRHILYPVEFVPDYSKAAPYVVSLAERYTATLTIMNVREDMPTSANAAEEFPQPIKRWIRDHVPQESDMGDRIRFERGFGPAANAIVDFAAKAGVDLIVMSITDLDPLMAAHHPNTGTAYELVSRAPCPVLTIR